MTINKSSHSKATGSLPVMENRLPTCRNYWRFGSATSPPQKPSSYLLKPHLIASSGSAAGIECKGGNNPNSKYYKLRHGPAASQFSPLVNDEIMMMSYQQYRVRLPFDALPFRGISRYAFWISFLAILILLLVLITALLRVEDFHMRSNDGDQSDQQNLQGATDAENDNHGSKNLKNSFIFKTLTNSVGLG